MSLRQNKTHIARLLADTLQCIGGFREQKIVHKVLKGGIFRLDAAFHCRLGVWVFDLCHLARFPVNVNIAFACTLSNFTARRSLDDFGGNKQPVPLGNAYQPFGFRFASISLAVI